MHTLISELSWWIFALAGILVLGIALQAVFCSRLRRDREATRNLVEGLRYE